MLPVKVDPYVIDYLLRLSFSIPIITDLCVQLPIELNNTGTLVQKELLWQ